MDRPSYNSNYSSFSPIDTEDTLSIASQNTSKGSLSVPPSTTIELSSSSTNRRHRRILPEPVYLACTSYLVKKHYFPSLLSKSLSSAVTLNESDDCNDVFMDGVETESTISSTVASSGITLLTSSTSSISSSSTSVSLPFLVRKYKLDSFDSLDAFHTRFTSEDNASFGKLMRKLNSQKKIYWRRHFGTELEPTLTSRLGQAKYRALEGSIYENSVNDRAGRRLLSTPSPLGLLMSSAVEAHDRNGGQQIMRHNTSFSTLGGKSALALGNSSTMINNTLRPEHDSFFSMGGDNDDNDSMSIQESVRSKASSSREIAQRHVLRNLASISSSNKHTSLINSDRGVDRIDTKDIFGTRHQ